MASETKKPLRAFISFAHADKRYVEILNRGLEKSTKHSKHFEWKLWIDKEIPLGSKWFKEIKGQIAESDIAILLVSSEFMYSDFIAEHEFKEFVRLSEEKDFLFFPLLLSPCDFSQLEK